jgi:hypothetical protein
VCPEDQPADEVGEPRRAQTLRYQEHADDEHDHVPRDPPGDLHRAPAGASVDGQEQRRPTGGHIGGGDSREALGAEADQRQGQDHRAGEQEHRSLDGGCRR